MNHTHTDQPLTTFAWPGPLGPAPTPFAISAPAHWERRWMPGTLALFDAGVGLELPPSGVRANLVIQRREVDPQLSLADLAARALDQDAAESPGLELLDEAVAEVSGRRAVIRHQLLPIGDDGAGRADQVRMLVHAELGLHPWRELHEVIATCDRTQSAAIGGVLDAALRSFRLLPVEGAR